MSAHSAAGPVPSDEPSPRLRPQSLMLTYLGNYVLGRDIAVFSGSFIDTFARLGVGEHAVRSTLTRMVGRGLLARHREGRRMHFGLTRRSAGILHDGEDRVWRRGVLNTDWDGSWTVLAFSMPESWQRVRHDLRARLTWAGFGSLGNGTWIAPSRVDVRPIVAGLNLNGHLKVFAGPAEEPTDVPHMLREAFDLDGLAANHRAFLDRWDRPDPLPHAPDDLARYLWMTTEWLHWSAPTRGCPSSTCPSAGRRPRPAGPAGAAGPLRGHRAAPRRRRDRVRPDGLIPGRPA